MALRQYGEVRRDGFWADWDFLECLWDCCVVV